MDPAVNLMGRVDLTRRTLARLGAGGLALALAARGLSATAQDATPAVAEEVELGVELNLTKGDALFAEAFRDEMRNAGEDDVVLLMAALKSVDEDFQID